MSSVVSLDVGSSTLAGVELSSTRDHVSLTRAAIDSLPDGLMIDGEVAMPEELASHIQEFWQANKFGTKRVRLGVANQRVVVRTVEMPAFDDPAMGRRERVVLVAAHREMIDSLANAVRRAGLQPVGIDLEAFALIRALLPEPSVVDQGNQSTPAQVICHVGAGMTNVVVAVDRQCQFTRLVSFGGRSLTQAVAERTGMPPAEAEALKRTCGLLGEVPDGWDQNAVAAVRHALAVGARPLVQEIGRSLDYYRSQQFSRPIDRLILSGGTSLCAGLDRYLQQALGVRVELADPMAQLDAGEASPEIAARAVVAVGLALDGTDPS
jgi:type IV pilus assembly protein PilM